MSHQWLIKDSLDLDLSLQLTGKISISKNKTLMNTICLILVQSYVMFFLQEDYLLEFQDKKVCQSLYIQE
jgi:hypothetical protein